MKKEDKYSKSLRDPRWQKKRLEIMQRDDFTCQYCGAKDKPLNVHHIGYEKGKKPWEYAHRKMITLCEDCHRHEHKSEDNIKSFIDFFRKDGVLMPEIEAILCSSMIRMIGCGDFDLAHKSMPKEASALEWNKLNLHDLCKRLSEWHKKVDTM